MPKYKKYYVVEYRIPIVVEDSDSIQSAVSMAKRICERQHGIAPDNWYARVFEYDSGSDDTGPVKEYFYNPNSSSAREIEKNIGYHNDLVEKGIDPTKDLDNDGKS